MEFLISISKQIDASISELNEIKSRINSFILKDSDLQKGHSNRKKPKKTIAPTTTKSIPRTTRGRF